MNKFKYIPVLALAALLTSCNLFGGKAPKFAEEGEQVEYSYFYDRCQQVAFDSELNDTNVKLTDRILKISNYESSNNVTKRDRKEIDKTESTHNSKSESQYDADNLVAKYTGEDNMSMKSSGPSGNGSFTLKNNSENYFQFEKENGSYYLVIANTKSQEYALYREASSSSSRQATIFDELVRYNILEIFESFRSYVPESSSDARDYLFYIKDDSIFTMSLTKDETENNEYYEITTKTKLKVQIDITDKKQALRVSSESKIEYIYHINYDGHKAGDVVTENHINYCDYAVTSKNVNLSAVDVSNYYLR